MNALEPTSPDLAAEVRTLQTRMRWLIGIVCLLAVTVVWREGVTRNRLEARAFVLVDDRGVERGLWRTWGAESRFVMHDANGTWRINLHVADSGYTATLFGPAESTQVQLTTVGDEPTVTLSANGNELTFSLAPDGSPRMTARGSDGTVQEMLPGAEQR